MLFSYRLLLQSTKMTVHRFSNIYLCVQFTRLRTDTTLHIQGFSFLDVEFRSATQLGSKVLIIRSSPSILVIKSELHCGRFAPLHNSLIFLLFPNLLRLEIIRYLQLAKFFIQDKQVSFYFWRVNPVLNICKFPK